MATALRPEDVIRRIEEDKQLDNKAVARKAKSGTWMGK